jgi:hypothetical protein
MYRNLFESSSKKQLSVKDAYDAYDKLKTIGVPKKTLLAMAAVLAASIVTWKSYSKKKRETEFEKLIEGNQKYKNKHKL